MENGADLLGQYSALSALINLYKRKAEEFFTEFKLAKDLDRLKE